MSDENTAAGGVPDRPRGAGAHVPVPTKVDPGPDNRSDGIAQDRVVTILAPSSGTVVGQGNSVPGPIPTTLDPAFPASGGGSAPPDDSAPGRVPTTLDADAPTTVVYHQLPPGVAVDYQLLERLGGGGEAVVYRARDVRGAREVAIKIYNIVPSYSFEIGDEQHRAHFRHEHTVDLFERREESGVHVEVMELCPLGTLDGLAAGQPMSNARLTQVIREIAEALNSMHPMYHGDVKPQNILVRSLEPLDLVLTDFGLSKNLKDRARKTSLGQGTHLYQPPEAAYASQLADDWWALGMVVAELAAGYHPFDGLPGEDRGGRRIREYLTTHRVPLDHLTDSRVRLLCTGLLTRLPEDRWGYAQVKEWLAGGSPAVKDGVVEEQPRLVFAFDGVHYTDPAELGTAMRTSPNGAELGQGVRLVELLTWLEGTAKHAPVASIAKGAQTLKAEATAALIATVLVGDGRAVFRGLDLASDADLPKAGEKEALKDLFEKELLRHFGTIADNPELTAMDHRWRQLVKQARSALPTKVPGDVDPAYSIILGWALQLMLNPSTAAREIRNKVDGEVRGNRWIAKVEWFRSLRQQEPSDARELALVASLPAAQADADELKVQELRERERLRRERAERRNSRLLEMPWPMLWMGVVWQGWTLLTYNYSAGVVPWTAMELWYPAISHLVMMALVVAVSAPVAGYLRFGTGTVNMLVLMAGMLGMASFPLGGVFADGWSPYRMLGFEAFTPDARFWPHIAGVLVAAVYALVIRLHPRRDKTPPQKVISEHAAVVTLAVLPTFAILVGFVFFQSSQPSADSQTEFQFLFAHLTGVLAFFAFLYMGLMWLISARRGYSRRALIWIMVVTAALQVAYFLPWGVSDYFIQAEWASCDAGLLCPTNGFSVWWFTPMGLALALLLLYAIVVIGLWAVRAAKSRLKVS